MNNIPTTGDVLAFIAFALFVATAPIWATVATALIHGVPQ